LSNTVINKAIGAGGGATFRGVTNRGDFYKMRGGCGAVRIVWPGNTRQFPSTCVSNL
jgi:hypothetical protein